MASYSFSISVQNTPPIQVYGVNITYEELLNSFGAYYYLIEKMFLQADQILQISQYLSFEKYKATGNLNKLVINPAIDPYSKQASILLLLEKNGIVIDSQLTMQTVILPLSFIRYTFFTQRGYTSKQLNQYYPPNKAQVKDV